MSEVVRHDEAHEQRHCDRSIDGRGARDGRSRAVLEPPSPSPVPVPVSLLPAGVPRRACPAALTLAAMLGALSSPALAAAEPRVLIVLTSQDRIPRAGRATGFYLSELTHALDVFERAGIAVDLASPKGGAPPMDGVDRSDPANARFLADRTWQARLAHSRPLTAVQADRYGAIYIAGGHGAMFDLPGNAALGRLIAAIDRKGGVVAAVCHGPAALVDVRGAGGRPLVADRAVSAFTDEEERAVGLAAAMPFLLQRRLVERGAHFEAAGVFQAHVAVDGRLVTGQNPASARGVAEAVVTLLRAAQR